MISGQQQRLGQAVFPKVDDYEAVGDGAGRQLGCEPGTKQRYVILDRLGFDWRGEQMYGFEHLPFDRRLLGGGGILRSESQAENGEPQETHSCYERGTKSQGAQA